MTQPTTKRNSPFVVIEIPVQPQDVLVPQMRLDLNLSSKLVFHARLEELGLLQHLQRNYVLGRYLTSQVNRSKLPTTERLANFKVG